MTGDYPINNIINPDYTINTGFGSNCHGCMGRGWVETSDRQPHKCPVCIGSGKYSQPLNPYPLTPYPYIPDNPFKPVGPFVPQYPTWPYTIISTSGGFKNGDKIELNPVNMSEYVSNVAKIFNGTKLDLGK